MATDARHLAEHGIAERKAAIDALISKAVDHLLGRNGRHAPLAAHIGVAPSGISRRLNGETTWSAAEVRLVADYFGRPVAELYTDPDTWRPPNESHNVHVPPSQSSLLLPDGGPAFDFDRSNHGLVLAVS